MRKVYIQSTLVNTVSTTRLDTAGAMLNQRLSRCASTPPAQHQCIVRTASNKMTLYISNLGEILTSKHVTPVFTTCAVRACPRSTVLSSSKLYSASDAVPIYPHVLPRLQRGCSSSSTRTTSAVSRETTF